MGDDKQKALQRRADGITREELTQQEERKGAIDETRRPGLGIPPDAIPAAGNERSIEAGPTSGKSTLPTRPEVGGTPYGGTGAKARERNTEPTTTKVTPEGPKPDLHRSPGERRRRGATH